MMFVVMMYNHLPVLWVALFALVLSSYNVVEKPAS